MARFKTSTVSGYSGINPSTRARPGVTAHVLDTFYAHAVVATFRSEDQDVPGRGRTRGQDGAREAAEARCAELNALELAHA